MRLEEESKALTGIARDLAAGRLVSVIAHLEEELEELRASYKNVDTMEALRFSQGKENGLRGVLYYINNAAKLKEKLDSQRESLLELEKMTEEETSEHSLVPVTE